MFGTYYLPEDENTWPSGTGVTEAQYPKGYIKQAIHPFVQNPFDENLNIDEKSER